ncbi:hypothetical protein B0H14DRAFT_3429482 [Mycena olivaceomarginata]|nr:hypothetical protein B0H14DRAFT_3429482 [Mycena olivaceomarginata]
MGSGPVPDLLPSSAFASPASSAGTASPPTPPTPPPFVFIVTLLDVAEHPHPLTNSRKRERGRLSALLHGHWHVFHHGHRTGMGQTSPIPLSHFDSHDRVERAEMYY